MALGVIVPLLVVAACVSQPEVPAEKICTPGNYVYCRCKDRSEGTKLCHDDGVAFDPCSDCSSGSEDNGPGDPEPEAGLDDAATFDGPFDSAVTLGHPAPGELWITEIMFDPGGPEPAEEWFEVTSTAKKSVVLNGLFLRDGGGRLHVLGPTPPMQVAPGQVLLLVRNVATALASGLPANKIIAEYGTGDSNTGGILLTNGATGSIAILDGATELVKVPYGTFVLPSDAGGTGSSIQLVAVGGRGEGGSWCTSEAPWPGQPPGRADRGSPGAPSTCGH